MTDSSYSRTETAYHRPDSPEALEQEVNAERHRVAETLDALQDKMQVGNLVDDVVRSFSRYGGDMAGNLGRQVRQNPLPLLLTGVGLVWLISSSGRSRPRHYDEDYLWDVDDDDLYEEDFVGTRRYGTASGARPYGTAGVGGTYDEGSGTGGTMRGAAGSAASGVSGAAGSAARGVGSVASSAASGVSHAAGTLASGVERAAEAVRSGLGSAASAVTSGARGAFSGARHTGGSVRESAYRASRGAYDAGGYTVRRLDDMIHDHPLVMGALALALGAAIGGALPRTRTEDEYLGEYSDQAKEAAREAAEREYEKGRRVAGAVADEARHIYEEKAEEVDRRLREAAHQSQSATDRVKSEAASAAERLRDAARSEAERQNLGDPKKPA
jgi:hypothetical protein